MISKHTIRAEVVTPDTLSYGGYYETTGSWQALTTPALIESNGFETSLNGWVKGTAQALGRTSSWANTGTYAAVVTPGDLVTGTFHVDKTLTGLTVGRTYRVGAYVTNSVDALPTNPNPVQVRLAINGVGAATYVALSGNPAPFTLVEYTFTATTTTHTLRLDMYYPSISSATPQRVLFDDFELVATTKWVTTQVWHPETVSIPGVRIPLDVQDASVTLDESWSPYAQVNLTCPLPAPETLAQIDPRDGTRVQMWLHQRFGESQAVSAMSAYRVPVRTPGAVERTNLVTNPSFETNTTGWTAVLGCTIARSTAQAYAGTASLAVTMTGTGSAVAGQPSTLYVPATPGVSYVASAYVRAATVVRQMRVAVSFYDSAKALLSGGGYGLFVTNTTSDWTRVSSNVSVAPVGTAFVTVSVGVISPVVAGEVHYVDAVLLEQAVTIGSYFDGSTTDTTDSEYAWTGTAHASTSTWAPASMVPGVALPTLADLSTRYAGKLVASISSDYGMGYNPGVGMRQSTSRSADLTLVTRQVDEVEGTMTITCMSDEIVAQRAALATETTTTPGGTSLIGAINLGLARISSALYSTVDDVTDLDTDSLVWTPGTSVWDYLANLVTSSERRLWADELGAWRLGYPAAPGEGALHVNPIRTASVDTLSTEGWYDGVVVEWRWTDGAGVDHVKYENAGPTDARKVFKAVRDNKPYPRSGAAKTLLKWLSINGRNVRIEAVSDYTAAPGQVVNVTLPDGTYATGVIQSVTWNVPDDRMTIITRDLLEAPPGSWLEDDPGVAWNAIPVGIDWTEDI